MKRCTSCLKEMDASSFYVNGVRKGVVYLRSQCKDCFSQNMKKWYLKNSEKIRAARIIYYEKNKERYNEKSRQWAKNNRDRNNATLRLYRKTKESDTHKIARTLRSRIHAAVKSQSGAKKARSTFNLIGCSIDEFKKYIQDRFLPGMAWNNRGLQGWHIDHIKPCSSFDLTNPDEQIKCFHYTNMQPLWAVDNWKKGGRLIQNK